jgi:hypothetical protein
MMMYDSYTVFGMEAITMSTDVINPNSSNIRPIYMANSVIQLRQQQLITK